ncbi:olfactomedin-4-like [Pelobates fuscus]|uniref:olfactomedin-4-like n=1 Tax=Pelobates fuscus TaxID=191477 RepID=UPI002FE4F4D7
MRLFLIIALSVCQANAASLEVNSTGSLDENGVCKCAIILPDTTFPVERMEFLEMANYNLSLNVQQAVFKIQSYQVTLVASLQKLKNLTRRVEVMELGGISYTELDFELLKLEIREMESLAIQLRASFNGSSTLVETLFVEIQNISIMVNQLESHDKNNVLAVKREIASLRKRLEDCEKHQDNPAVPPVPYGTCKHGGIRNISKPFVVQLNYLGFAYKFGGWGKDSMLGADQDIHWVAPLTTDGRSMNSIRFYPSYDDLLLYKKPTDKVLTKPIAYNNIDYSSSGQGGGVIMFNESMYYNCYNTRDLCKFNTKTNAVERKTLTDATFNNRFSYASTQWQDIDLAADEDGLWVIYSTEQNAGNLIISKLNPTSMIVEKTWTTSQYKLGVTNTFMVCGILYATRTLNTRREEIFYMYDTKTSTEGKLSIPFDKMMENIQCLSYNPNDHKLYMYNDGYLVTYDLNYNPLP